MVEMHFWMMGVFFEPKYSYSRKMLTQLFMIVSVLDDLYDSHCTTEEGNAFTAALQRFATLMHSMFIFSSCDLNDFV
jgi:(-)-germacrene D synthase